MHDYQCVFVGSCPLPITHMENCLSTLDFCVLSADTRGGGDGPTAALIVSLDGPTGVLFWDLLEVPSPAPLVGTARLQ